MNTGLPSGVQAARNSVVRAGDLVLLTIPDHQVEARLIGLQGDKLGPERLVFFPALEGGGRVGYPAAIAGADLDHGELRTRAFDRGQQIDPLKIVFTVLVRKRGVVAIFDASSAGLDAIGEIRIEVWNDLDEVALQFVRNARSHEIV